MPEGGSVYDAFISYAREDEAVAIAVQAGLEHLAKSRFSWRALRVFRDDTDLASNPSLWEAIRHSLDQSRHLVVLNSPAAAQSEWVNREVEYFARTGKPIHIVQVSGNFRWCPDPTPSGDPEGTSRPVEVVSALRDAFPEEPLALLLPSGPGSSLSLSDGTFRRVIARLAAPMRNVEPEDLEDEDRRIQRRELRLARGAVAALLVLAISTGAGAWIARVQASKARVQAAHAASRYLASRSAALMGQQPDLAMLLAAASFRLEDSDISRQSMLDALQYSPYLRSYATQRDSGPRGAGIAMSPSGRRVASFGQEGVVTVWNASGGHLTQMRFPARLTGIRSLVFADEDRLRATANDGATVTLNLRTGTRDTWRPPGGADQVLLNQSGSTLVTYTKRAGVQLWNLDAHHRDAVLRGVSKPPDVMALSTDGKRLAAVTNRIVRFYDVKTGQMSGKPIALGHGYAYGVGFSADLGEIAFDIHPTTATTNILATDYTIGESAGLALLDVRSGNRQTLPHPTDVTTSESFSFAGPGLFLLAGDHAGRIALYGNSTIRAEGIALIHGHAGDVKAISSDREGDLAASVDQSGHVILWSLGPSGAVAENNAAPLSPVRVPGYHGQMVTGQVLSATFDAVGNNLLTSADDGSVHVDRVAGREPGNARDPNWGVRIRTPDPYTGWPLHTTYLGATGWVIAALPNGDLLSFGRDEPPPGYIMIGSTGHGNAQVVTDAAGDLIVTASDAGNILTWRKNGHAWTSRLLARMTGAPFTSLALDAHARYLAVGRRGEPTGVWDLSARRRIATVPAFDVGIVSADESSPVLAFEPGTDVLAVGRSDGTVLLWNPVSRRQIGSKLKISDGSVISIGFSPDGSILAVGLTFTDGVLLYDARTLQEIGQLGSDGGIVTSLAFSPDGRTLATGDQHGRVRLWSLSAADWARRLCDVVHRDITAREWTTVAGDLPRTAVCPTPR